MNTEGERTTEAKKNKTEVKPHFSDTIKNAHAAGDGAINRGNEAIEGDKDGQEKKPEESTY